MQRLDAINVDEMRGLGEAKRHDGDETLPAREDAAILGRHFSERLDGFFYRFRRVVTKGRGFHFCFDRPVMPGLCRESTFQRLTSDCLDWYIVANVCKELVLELAAISIR